MTPSGDYAQLFKTLCLVRKTPGFQFRRNVALVLCRMNRWDEAVTELKAVLSEEPADPDATKALYIALEHVRGQNSTRWP